VCAFAKPFESVRKVLQGKQCSWEYWWFSSRFPDCYFKLMRCVKVMKRREKKNKRGKKMRDER
jgi:hypothetical protein